MRKTLQIYLHFYLAKINEINTPICTRIYGDNQLMWQKYEKYINLNKEYFWWTSFSEHEKLWFWLPFVRNPFTLLPWHLRCCCSPAALLWWRPWMQRCPPVCCWWRVWCWCCRPLPPCSRGGAGCSQTPSHRPSLFWTSSRGAVMLKCFCWSENISCFNRLHVWVY